MRTINSAPPPLIAISRNFSDTDEFAAEIIGWDLDFRQLETGNSDIAVELIASPNIIIQHYFFPHAVHQRGMAPAGFTTIGLPFGECSLNWASRNIFGAVAVGFNGANGFDGASGPEFHGISLSISNDFLSRNATSMGLDSPPILESAQAILRSPKRQEMIQLRQYLHLICQRVLTQPQPEDIDWALFQLENEVPVRYLTALLELQHSADSTPLRARQNGLRKAIEFIDENAYDNPSIPDICTACCLSWRSLDRAFKECFGIGPKRYLLQFRLIRVRQMLKNAPETAKVSDIANAWGFWHMGDFAHKYRRFFGINPAQQLMNSA